jgi:hypothetical protein
MITDEQMRAAAAALADEARENYGGVDVISVGPAYTSNSRCHMRAVAKTCGSGVSDHRLRPHRIPGNRLICPWSAGRAQTSSRGRNGSQSRA